jgi:amino acid transporter
MRISRFSHADPVAGSAPTYVGQEIDPSLDYVTGWSMVMDYILALYPASRMKSILELRGPERSDQVLGTFLTGAGCRLIQWEDESCKKI